MSQGKLLMQTLTIHHYRCRSVSPLDNSGTSVLICWRRTIIQYKQYYADRHQWLALWQATIVYFAMLNYRKSVPVSHGQKHQTSCSDVWTQKNYATENCVW